MSLLLKKRRRSSVGMFPEEIYFEIFNHFIDCPEKLLMIAHTNKELFRLIMNHHELWFKILSLYENTRLQVFFSSYPRPRTFAVSFLPNIARDLNMNVIPDFRMAIHHHVPHVHGTVNPTWPPRPIEPSEQNELVKHCQKVMFLKYGKFCGVCGHKHKNTPVWKLGKRVCDMCLRDNLINNVQLFLKYGIDYIELFKRYSEQFKTVFAFEYDSYYSGSRYVNQHYSWSHLDSQTFKKNHIVCPTPSVFFWKSHLDRFVDFENEKKINVEKAKAAETLCAYVRSFYTKMLICHRGNPFSIIQKLRNEVRKKKLPYPSFSDITLIIRKIIIGRLLEESVLFRNLKAFFERFRHRRSIMCDHNPRKIMEIVRSHEAQRCTSIQTFMIKGKGNSNISAFYAQWNAVVG